MTTRGTRKRRGFTGWAWRLLLLVLVWLLGVAAYIVWVGERDQAAKADVIIVLGAAAYDANPSPVFEERIRHGIDPVSYTHLDVYKRQEQGPAMCTAG